MKKHFDKALGVGLSAEEKKYRALSSMKKSQERNKKIKAVVKIATGSPVKKVLSSVVKKGLKKLK